MRFSSFLQTFVVIAIVVFGFGFAPVAARAADLIVSEPVAEAAYCGGVEKLYMPTVKTLAPSAVKVNKCPVQGQKFTARKLFAKGAIGVALGQANWMPAGCEILKRFDPVALYVDAAAGPIREDLKPDTSASRAEVQSGAIIVIPRNAGDCGKVYDTGYARFTYNNRSLWLNVVTVEQMKAAYGFN